MAPKRRYEEFADPMKSLLETGKHSDFAITCGDKTWKVHKAIVCSQSNFFDAASRFGKEATEGKVNLPEDDPEIVKYMIQFMYESDYRLPSDDVPGPLVMRIDTLYSKVARNPPIANGNLWRTADRFLWDMSAKILKGFIPKLSQELVGRELEVSRLENYGEELNPIIHEAFSGWQQHGDNPLSINHDDASIHVKVYSIADKYNVKGLKQAAAEKFEESLRHIFSGDSFFEAVRAAFTTTPEDDSTLREVVAKRIHVEKEKYGVYEELDESIQSVPGLAYHIWKYEWSLTDKVASLSKKRRQIERA